MVVVPVPRAVILEPSANGPAREIGKITSSFKETIDVLPDIVLEIRRVGFFDELANNVSVLS